MKMVTELVECEYGSPQKGNWKDVTGQPSPPTIKKGQYVRAEIYVPMTDEQVNTVCSDLRPNICKTIENLHWTYVYVSNTITIIEGQATADTTSESWPPPVNMKVYVLELPIWQKYKYPIIAGIAITALATGIYITTRRKK